MTNFYASIVLRVLPSVNSERVKKRTKLYARERLSFVNIDGNEKTPTAKTLRVSLNTYFDCKGLQLSTVRRTLRFPFSSNRR